MTPIDDPFRQRAAEACRYGFSKEPIIVGEGGSIGAVPHFQRVFPQSSIVLLAQSLLTDGYHKPNEHFRIDHAMDCIKTVAHYLRSIATLRTE